MSGASAPFSICLYGIHRDIDRPYCVYVATRSAILYWRVSSMLLIGPCGIYWHNKHWPPLSLHEARRKRHYGVHWFHCQYVALFASSRPFPATWFSIMHAACYVGISGDILAQQAALGHLNCLFLQNTTWQLY
jgi:hypothetical protein